MFKWKWLQSVAGASTIYEAPIMIKTLLVSWHPISHSIYSKSILIRRPTASISRNRWPNSLLRMLTKMAVFPAAMHAGRNEASA